MRSTDLNKYLILQVVTLMSKEEKGFTQGCQGMAEPSAKARFPGPQAELPCMYLTVLHGRALPPAIWKPFVLSQLPPSPKPVPRTREEGARRPNPFPIRVPRPPSGPGQEFLSGTELN